MEPFPSQFDRLVASLNSDNQLSALAESTCARAWSIAPFTAWTASNGGAISEIADEAIAAPVFLTGLPRSGTTYFQYLFEKDPRFRLIRMWESITPSPPPGYDPEFLRRRKAEEEQRRREAIPKKIKASRPYICSTWMVPTNPTSSSSKLTPPRAIKTCTTCRLFRPYDEVAGFRRHLRGAQATIAAFQWRMKRPRWAVKYPTMSWPWTRSSRSIRAPASS